MSSVINRPLVRQTEDFDSINLSGADVPLLQCGEFDFMLRRASKRYRCANHRKTTGCDPFDSLLSCSKNSGKDVPLLDERTTSGMPLFSVETVIESEAFSVPLEWGCGGLERLAPLLVAPLCFLSQYIPDPHTPTLVERTSPIRERRFYLTNEQLYEVHPGEANGSLASEKGALALVTGRVSSTPLPPHRA